MQGVGFRPHVYRLAEELGLDGYVLNDVRGVMLEVEGTPTAVERFLERLVAEPPPLATIESVKPHELAPTDRPGFQIAPSRDAGERSGLRRQALVSPDTATCTDCLAEMRDPHDRRYRYPFINCTNCGPRFTIATGVPYDRPLTTMAGFAMCKHCRAEYEDPGDRRFHAQPNACPVCGPRARLLGPDLPERAGARHVREEEGTRPVDDAVRAAAEALAGGLIVAVKGLGGFHLACRADASAAVETLRARKRREDRPFALMAPGVAAVRTLIELDTGAQALLEDPRATDRDRPPSRRSSRGRGRCPQLPGPRSDAGVHATSPSALGRSRRARRAGRRVRSVPGDDQRQSL